MGQHPVPVLELNPELGVGQGFSDEPYGVGIKKGNTALRDQVNAALRQYVADGSWAAALRITVAPSGYHLPSPPTPGAA